MSEHDVISEVVNKYGDFFRKNGREPNTLMLSNHAYLLFLKQLVSRHSFIADVDIFYGMKIYRFINCKADDIVVVVGYSEVE